MNEKAASSPIPSTTPTSELTKMVRPPLIFENFVDCSCPTCTRTTISISRKGTFQELKGYEVPSQLNEMCDGCIDAGCSENCTDSDSGCLNESGSDQPFCTEYQPYTTQEVLDLLGRFLTKEDLGGADASTN